MSLVGSIKSNAGALSVLSAIRTSTEAVNTTSTQLATGLAISTAADNPADYITAQGLTTKIGGVDQAISNVNQDISLTQTAQQAIQQQINIAQTLLSIAIEAANGTVSPAQRQSLQAVSQRLLGQMNNIAQTTQFNGISLLNGTVNDFQFQTGANEGQNSMLSIPSTLSSALGISNGPVLPRVTRTFVKSSSEYSSGTLSITGPRGRSGPIMVTKNESAYSLAQAINAFSSQTGVMAKSSNTISLKFDTSSASGAVLSKWGFGLNSSAGSGSPNLSTQVTPNSSSSAMIVRQINTGTSNTGISATKTASGMVLSQAQGKNIFIGMPAHSASNNLTHASGVSIQYGVSPAEIHGSLRLVSGSGTYTITNGSLIGYGSNIPQNPHGDPLSDINLSTASTAADAISVIKGAMTQLDQIAGNIGAVQDGLKATSENLSCTSANTSTALGAVQDANIPEVINVLSEKQIQAQIGVSALKQSTNLQKYFLSLLP